jgi:hypothetical protein
LLLLLLTTPALAQKTDPLLRLREARKEQKLTGKRLPGLGLTRTARQPGIFTGNSKKDVFRHLKNKYSYGNKSRR